MKKILVFFLFFTSTLALLCAIVLVAPYYYFNEAIDGRLDSEWYSLDNYARAYLNPGVYNIYQEQSLDRYDKRFFKDYQIGDTVVALPHRNPFLTVRPELFLNSRNDLDYKINILSINGKLFNEIKFIQGQRYHFKKSGQKIFELPLVKEILKSYSDAQIWKDLFTLKIGN